MRGFGGLCLAWGYYLGVEGGIPLLLPRCWAQSWGLCPAVCPGAVSPLGLPQPGPFGAKPPAVPSRGGHCLCLDFCPLQQPRCQFFVCSTPSQCCVGLKTLPLRSFNAFLLTYSPLRPAPGCVCPGGGR